VSATVYEVLCNTQVCNKNKAICVNMWISLRPKFQNKVNNTSITPTIRYRHMCLDASCLTPTTRPQWLCQWGRPGMIWSHQCSHFFLFLVSYFAMMSYIQDFTAQMADEWIWIWNIATIILIWETGIFKKKACPSTTLSTTNPTQTGLGSNLGLHVEAGDQLSEQ
jgi:hypothetical protein